MASDPRTELESVYAHRDHNVELNLYFDEHRIDAPDPIERTLHLHSTLMIIRDQAIESFSPPIGVAQLDEAGTSAAVAWPVAEGVELRSVINVCFDDFLRAYGPDEAVRLEFRLGDDYWEPVQVPNADLAMLRLDGAREPPTTGPLRLIQLSRGTTAVELLFDDAPERLTRLAVLVSTVRPEPLARLFTLFHQNPFVRSDMGFVVQAFGGRISGLIEPAHWLDPLPVVPKELTWESGTNREARGSHSVRTRER